MKAGREQGNKITSYRRTTIIGISVRRIQEKGRGGHGWELRGRGNGLHSKSAEAEHWGIPQETILKFTKPKGKGTKVPQESDTLASLRMFNEQT